MCPPQGIPSGEILRVATAPRREAIGSGHAGFDRVAEVAALARGWLKAQSLPHTADAVVAMAALALKIEREARDEAKRAVSSPDSIPRNSSAKHVPPAPDHARRRASPPARKEPTP